MYLHSSYHRICGPCGPVLSRIAEDELVTGTESLVGTTDTLHTGGPLGEALALVPHALLQKS